MAEEEGGGGGTVLGGGSCWSVGGIRVGGGVGGGGSGRLVWVTGAGGCISTGSDTPSGIAGREGGAPLDPPSGEVVVGSGGMTPLATSCAICRDCSFSSSTISFCT